jgi:hypothetical protein
VSGYVAEDWNRKLMVGRLHLKQKSGRVLVSELVLNWKCIKYDVELSRSNYVWYVKKLEEEQEAWKVKLEQRNITELHCYYSCILVLLLEKNVGEVSKAGVWTCIVDYSSKAEEEEEIKGKEEECRRSVKFKTLLEENVGQLWKDINPNIQGYRGWLCLMFRLRTLGTIGI